MNLKDAFELIDAESNKSTKKECLITRQPIENEISLKCGHCFEYNALLQNMMYTQTVYNFHRCPYCRRKFENFIPFYEINDNIENVYNKNKQVFKKNDYLRCHHVFCSGKNKNNLCGKSANKFNTGIFCYQHYNKSKSTNKLPCSKILKNGNQCKCKMYDSESKLCKRHYNILNKI